MRPSVDPSPPTHTPNAREGASRGAGGVLSSRFEGPPSCLATWVINYHRGRAMDGSRALSVEIPFPTSGTVMVPVSPGSL